MSSIKIKKGDLVLVCAGKDRGKTGKIEKILPKLNRAVVTGINLLKKHSKPSKKYPKGGIIDIFRPIQLSNLRLICPHCQKTTRPKIKLTASGKKERLCRRCEKNLDEAVQTKTTK